MNNFLRFTLIICLELLACCNNGKNRRFENALEKSAVLKEINNIYKHDKSKYEAIRFIIENIEYKYSVPEFADVYELSSSLDSMINVYGSGLNNESFKNQFVRRNDNLKGIPDIDLINLDSLQASINFTLKIWDKAPWAKSYRPEQFYNYVLPYRVRREPLEYYWKQNAYDRFSFLLNQYNDPIDIAREVNKNIHFDFSSVFFGTGLQSYSSIMQTKRGRCDDGTLLRTMILRSLGIPASVDLVPYWGSQNNGHSMAVVILPDGTGIDIETLTRQADKDDFGHKTTKVYRTTYAIDDKSVLYRYKDSDEIHPVFSDLNFIDVTHQYNIERQDVGVKYDKTKYKIAYLTVFSRKDWMPVAYAKAGSTKAFFPNVGIGRAKDANQCKGVDIGDGIVYMPAFYNGEDIIPSGYPFILNGNGTYELRPDKSNTRTISVTRKYPRKNRIVEFAVQMKGGVFEGANNADFSDAVCLYSIDDIPHSRMQNVQINEGGTYKYVRYYKNKGGISLAEFGVTDSNNNPVASRLIADSFIMDEPGISNIADQSPLSYFEMSGVVDCWIGFEFEKAIQIGAINFCPRTDDNEICPGHSYELFYWDNVWVGLGRKSALAYSLTWEDVPQDALLWLRDLTAGVEERPFTFEAGKQIWW